MCHELISSIHLCACVHVSLRTHGESDVGDCASLAVQPSSSSDTHPEPGSHSLSGSPLKESPASQVTYSFKLSLLELWLPELNNFIAAEACEPRDRQWIWELILECVSLRITTTTSCGKVQFETCNTL